MLPLAALLTLVPFVASTPLQRASAVDTTVQCGQYDTVTAGQYSLLTNLWGESDATSGSQCSEITSLSGTTIAWATNWTWTGGTSVKSFSNIQLDDGINQQLSAISSMPTTWDWSQDSTGTVVADVAYDLFTSDTSGGSNVNEIMIWLANFNAGPISAEYNSDGDPVPVATDISLGGYTWDLYSGSNGANQVYSYLPTSGTIQSFNTDIYPFLTYLVDNEGVSSSQYLTTAQGGTEPTSGTATLTTWVLTLSF
ncbi:glycoside hydrolase family 12 protein [Leucogyrophana mollusca]|uniref:Glycoside hydrolase family 12 protein n=1 Tax=Leucogyrophana mollusca TaxID=85980 RepID=A0ACB8B5B0_9AGAM|nr:glycoside hydrolase family 12 protein [Leucogyrophana mollusca]